MKPRVLIIDDEKNTREGLQRAFKRKYDIILAENAAKGMMILEEEQIDVVLTDLRMPGIDGMTFTKEVAGRPNAPLVIMLTAYGSLQTAVDAMKVGAYDYLTKPVNLDNVEMVIDRGLDSRRLEMENDDLRKQLDSRYGLENIVGSSKKMVAIFETIRQVSSARSTVLITGESGTGKELVARALHQLSPRARNPYVVVHCAALNQNLLESELFGHEKGAFTSAGNRSIGRFEKANGGTIFLDEIGEIDLATQVKLLRVLENRTIERVGGSETIEVDVRLVAATNRDLKQMVDEGTFREDLYYRLDVVNVELPPLRERTDDIPLLLNHFLQKSKEENGRDLKGFTTEAVKFLSAYSWPGNVRELRNAVERMVVMARGTSLTLKDVPVDIRTAVAEALSAESPVVDSDSPVADPLNVDNNEKSLIVKALKETDGNKKAAADLLGFSRRTLYRKLEKYNLA